MNTKRWLRSQPKSTSVPTRRLYNAYRRKLRGGEDYEKDLDIMERTAQFQGQFKMKKNDGVMFTLLIDQNQQMIEKYEGGTHLLQIAAMLYLLAKHKNDCTPIGSFQSIDNSYTGPRDFRRYSSYQLSWLAIWPDYLYDFTTTSELITKYPVIHVDKKNFVPNEKLNTIHLQAQQQHTLPEGASPWKGIIYEGKYTTWDGLSVEKREEYLLRNELEKETLDQTFLPFYLDPEKTKLTEFEQAWNRMCASSEKRFIFVFLGVSTGILKENKTHANVLIYDRKRKELEHFEPHGGDSKEAWCKVAMEGHGKYRNTLMVQQLPNDPCDGDSLDRAIVKHLKPIIGFETYIPAKAYCPYLGFQSRQALKKQGVDPGGFCQYWSIYYIDLRLSNPDTPRDQLVKNALRNIEMLTVSETVEAIHPDFPDEGYFPAEILEIKQDSIKVHFLNSSIEIEVPTKNVRKVSDFGQFIRAYATFMELMVRMVVKNQDKGEGVLQKMAADMVAEFTDDVNYSPQKKATKPKKEQPEKKHPAPKPKKEKPEKKKQCCCVTGTGKPCTRKAAAGSKYCTQHKKAIANNNGKCSKKQVDPIC